MQIKLLFLLLSPIYIFANTFTLLSNEVRLDVNESFDSNDSFTLFGGTHYITSNRAVYKNNRFNFCGNVNSIEKQDVFILADDININKEQDNADFTSMFMLNQKDGLWVSVKNAHLNKNRYKFRDSITSSCEIDRPTWSISFEKGTYNTNTEWVSLYHPTFYIKDFPVFYFPYFGFSANKDRSSGLLRPDFGISSEEGVFFSQPIFWAIQDNLDMEFTFQTRTERGNGLYTDFRYADSNSSLLELSLGYFQEKDSYKNKFNLKHDAHYGIELKYEKDGIFDKYLKNYSDGVYLDSIWLNDIDYLNLKKSMNYFDSTTNTIQSKFNYGMSNESDYIGLYSRYFIDTSKNSNKDTFQNLPTFQYHKFSDEYNFGFGTFLTSIDLKTKNYYREKGTRANQQELSIPINFYFPILNDYLTLKVSEKIYLSNIDYSKEYKSGIYFTNYHDISLMSELIKPYDNFLHTVYFETSLVVPSYTKRKSDISDFILFDEEREKSVRFKFTQNFFDTEGNHRLSHRLTQDIYLENDREDKYGELENELLYNIDSKLKVYNDLFYSHKLDKITANIAMLDLQYEDYDFSLSHYYEELYSSFLIFDFDTKLKRDYNTFVSLKYDIDDSFLKSWEIGTYMKQNCWDYRVSYKEELNPVSTTDGVNAVRNKVIYFQINLIPLGGVKQKIKRQSRG